MVAKTCQKGEDSLPFHLYFMAGKLSAFLIFANFSGKAISGELDCNLDSCSAVIPRFPGMYSVPCTKEG